MRSGNGSPRGYRRVASNDGGPSDPEAARLLPEPLTGAFSKNGLFGSLTPEEHRIEERIRTLALSVVALGVVGAALYFLRAVLVPLVLALALKYLLQPLIDILSVRPLRCCGLTLCANARSPEDTPSCLRPITDCFCQLKLPRWLAACVALAVAFATLATLGFVVADSMNVFLERSKVYSARLEHIFDHVIGWMDEIQASGFVRLHGFHKRDSNPDPDSEAPSPARLERIQQLTQRIPVTSFVLAVFQSLLDALSNLFLVLLFTVFLLLGSTRAEDDGGVKAQADAQIFAYVKGKVLLSLMVGGLTGFILWSLHVDLWLVFGVLAFWLNFIPNVGAVVAVALPLPLILLDPKFTTLMRALAVGLPMTVHGVVANILEPVLFGHSMELQPVVVLVSLMLWGAVWGVTGMVLAVPMTAVLRIHLSHVEHPMTRYLVTVLVGRADWHAELLDVSAIDGMPVDDLTELVPSDVGPPGPHGLQISATWASCASPRSGGRAAPAARRRSARAR